MKVSLPPNEEVGTMRKLKVLTVATAGALALTGCGFLTGSDSGGGGDAEANGGQCEPTSIRVAMIRTANDPGTVAAEAMAERVAERTDGDIDIQVFPDSQLGDMNDAYAGVANGEIDVYYETNSTYRSEERRVGRACRTR